MLQYSFLLWLVCIYFWSILIHSLKSNHPHFFWQETGYGERELKPRFPLINTSHFLSFLQSDTTVTTKDEGSLDHGLCTCRIDIQNNNFLNQLSDTAKSSPSEPSFRQLRPHKYFTNENSLFNNQQNDKHQQSLPQTLKQRQVAMRKKLPLLHRPQQLPNNLVSRAQFSFYGPSGRNYRNRYGFIK